MGLRFNEPMGGPMARALPDVHPDLRQLLLDFALWSQQHGLPDPVVTDLVRDVPAQIRIYVRFWLKLQAALQPGPRRGQIDPEGDGTWRALTPAEAQRAKDVVGLTPQQLEEKARAQFTWHWCKCAADLRSRHYTPAEKRKVRAWFEARCPRPLWEFLIHDVTAPHIHVARRDFDWRRRLTVKPLPVS
jgi:hypothetical protein